MSGVIRMNKLIEKIEKWAEDRNIIKGSKPIDQAMKLFSEFGELADNVGKGRDCRDDIGDIFVVLTIMAKQADLNINNLIELRANDNSLDVCLKKQVNWLCSNLSLFVTDLGSYTLGSCIENLTRISNSLNYTIEECVQIAYDDIKDRVGILWNGVFVKNTDANYNEVKLMFEESMEKNFN